MLVLEPTQHQSLPPFILLRLSMNLQRGLRIPQFDIDSESLPDSHSGSSESDVESPSDSQTLRFIRPEILAALSHLDLSAHVIFKESKVVGAGTYGDVTSARCNIPRHGKKRVAIKRLRFYMAEDFKMVSSF